MPAEGHTLQAVESRWIRGLVVFLAAGAALYVIGIVWAGSEQTLRSIEVIGAVALAAGTLTSLSSYLFRFARWQLILLGLGHSLPTVFSLRVYLAGLALTTSPGKLGETLRSALLLQHGVPLPHSLAAFFADRLGDVIGVALLGATAGLITGNRLPILEATAGIVFGSSLIAAGVVRSPWWNRMLLAAGSQARFARIVIPVASVASAWAKVWVARRSVVYSLAAVIAFGIQGLVFAAFVKTVAPWVDTVISVEIYASSTLIGAASMIPAGLGAMEAAIVLQLTAQGVTTPAAVAVAVATRVATLWFGMIVGALMLLGLARVHLPRGETATGRSD
jgi:uncharacterized membrane protein YbhN (UPF0104 family)